MADGLLVHVRAIRRHTIGEADRAERSIVDHMHIIEALEARDAELAEKLVRDHALNLARHVDADVAVGSDLVGQTTRVIPTAEERESVTATASTKRNGDTTPTLAG